MPPFAPHFAAKAKEKTPAAEAAAARTRGQALDFGVGRCCIIFSLLCSRHLFAEGEKNEELVIKPSV